jgi:hypothetical protein
LLFSERICMILEPGYVPCGFSEEFLMTTHTRIMVCTFCVLAALAMNVHAMGEPIEGEQTDETGLTTAGKIFWSIDWTIPTNYIVRQCFYSGRPFDRDIEDLRDFMRTNGISINQMEEIVINQIEGPLNDYYAGQFVAYLPYFCTEKGVVYLESLVREKKVRENGMVRDKALQSLVPMRQADLLAFLRTLLQDPNSPVSRNDVYREVWCEFTPGLSQDSTLQDPVALAALRFIEVCISTETDLSNVAEFDAVLPNFDSNYGFSYERQEILERACEKVKAVDVSKTEDNVTQNITRYLRGALEKLKEVPAEKRTHVEMKSLDQICKEYAEKVKAAKSAAPGKDQKKSSPPVQKP